jgi:tetratricopeptide (TPR) repeat protein
MLIDPTWRVMGIKHQEFAVLDDLQAISHHAMQAGDGEPDPRQMRAGLKLNPDDRWTRLQFVRGMAQAGQHDAAAEELRKLRGGPETWDVHQVEADVHAAQRHWKEALDSLQRALALSPSNAAVHMAMARAYDHLGNQHDSDKHAEAALRLDRGEISAEMREFASFRVALGQARTQLKSGSDSSHRALQTRAEAGDVGAQIALAQICFEEGPKGIDEGFRWLRKAAAQGNAQAQLNYALNLLRRNGLDAGTEPVEWLTRAAEQGLDDAQYRLGLILYEGKLVVRDMAAAYLWVTLAAAQGSKEAKTLLKEMDIFIRPDDSAEARKRAAAFAPKKSAPVK